MSVNNSREELAAIRKQTASLLEHIDDMLTENGPKPRYDDDDRYVSWDNAVDLAKKCHKALESVDGPDTDDETFSLDDQP